MEHFHDILFAIDSLGALVLKVSAAIALWNVRAWLQGQYRITRTIEEEKKPQ